MPSFVLLGIGIIVVPAIAYFACVWLLNLVSGLLPTSKNLDSGGDPPYGSLANGRHQRNPEPADGDPSAH